MASSSSRERWLHTSADSMCHIPDAVSFRTSFLKLSRPQLTYTSTTFLSAPHGADEPRRPPTDEMIHYETARFNHHSNFSAPESSVSSRRTSTPRPDLQSRTGSAKDHWQTSHEHPLMMYLGGSTTMTLAPMAAPVINASKAVKASQLSRFSQKPM
eukprot:scaffold1436_cov250-Pinguiococcus_pyrenoidosus.AAC.8